MQAKIRAAGYKEQHQQQQEEDDEEMVQQTRATAATGVGLPVRVECTRMNQLMRTVNRARMSPVKMDLLH